ncbi:MAG: ATP-binding protein [Terrisporobacter othiniensis]|uniref:ATP-binding protein n=1 Tax=Terrisporobacter othiniensis TaxID=1577792 RepID=UPI002A753E35|nr:ATP-binding protein [Terrisporobacter othiniensis]MDY3372321.1 ATP-binding protein [Terrisporobacter othiniensis]
MKGNIIFLGGVHGVGKTTISRKISSQHNIENYSSSWLIEKIKGEKFENKFTDDINKNQDILVKAVNYYMDKSKKFILDGHFCLLNEKKEVVRIPEQTFKDLGLSCIIVIIDDEESICDRLKVRDNNKYDIELIKDLQRNEKSYAKEISFMLDIPVYYIDLSEENFIEKINNIKEI